MLIADRKIPSPDQRAPENKRYFEAAAQGRLLLRRCNACGRAHWYPRQMCPHCASMDTDWIAASGAGTLYSYSAMERVAEPYVLAYVTLAEGPTMMTNMVDCDTADLQCGKPVRLVFKASVDGVNVPMFTLA